MIHLQLYTLTPAIGLTFCHDTPSIIEGNYRLGDVRCQTVFPKKNFLKTQFDT